MKGLAFTKYKSEVPKFGTSLKESLAKRFCRCIKAVRKTVKVRKGSNKESAAIAICTKTMLQNKRGRTLKKFSCRNGPPMLKTQSLHSHASK